MVAFSQAVEAYKTDQLELDVHLTRDGHVIVFHDDTLERTTNGKGPVGEMTWAEIQRLDAGYNYTCGDGYPFRDQGVKVPLLEEVLTTFSVPVMMEIKDADARTRAAVVKVVRDTGATSRVCLGAWDAGQARALATEHPDLCLFFPEDAARGFVGAALTGKSSDKYPFDVLAISAQAEGMDLTAPPIMAAAKAAGIPVQVWTIDDPAEMTTLLDRGVAGIQTDRPDRLRQVLDARASEAGRKSVPKFVPSSGSTSGQMPGQGK